MLGFPFGKFELLLLFVIATLVELLLLVLFGLTPLLLLLVVLLLLLLLLFRLPETMPMGVEVVAAVVFGDGCGTAAGVGLIDDEAGGCDRGDAAAANFKDLRPRKLCERNGKWTCIRCM